MTRQIRPNIQERLDRFQEQVRLVVDFYSRYTEQRSHDYDEQAPEIDEPFRDIVNYNLALEGLGNRILRAEQIPLEIRQEINSLILIREY